MKLSILLFQLPLYGLLASAATSIFLVAPSGSGLQGSSRDSVYPGSIEVLSFNWAEHGPAGASKKPSFSEIGFSKYLDKSSAAWLTLTAQNKSVNPIIVYFRRTGDTGNFVYRKMTFNTVTPSSYNWNVGTSDDSPTESISFRYRAILDETFTETPSGGTSSQSASWDLGKNAPISGP